MDRQTCIGAMKIMKKILFGKSRIVPVLVALFVVCMAMLPFYKSIGLRQLEKSTWEYLHSQGYSSEDILSASFSHSYVSGLLGYGQWISEIGFTDEPYIGYVCVIDNQLWPQTTGLMAGRIKGDISEDYIFLHEDF